MPKKEICGRNWRKYNKSLVQRGDITLWIDEEIILSLPSRTNKRGRPVKYCSSLLKACLLIKNIFHKTFRETEGFISSLYKLMGIKTKCPDYTTMCRRQKDIKINLNSKAKGPLHLVVDSTGLKIIGEGEWCTYRHSIKRQRTWRKVHLAIDSENLQIMSYKVTESRAQDADQLEHLLSSIEPEINQISGDGAYDKLKCYDAAINKGAIAVIPPSKVAKPSRISRYRNKKTSPEALKMRDSVIERIALIGKKEWKKESGYHKRSLAETTMYRLKTVLGDRLKSRTHDNQDLEVGLRCEILNKINSSRLCFN